MIPLLKPAPLQKGDTIAIISPSSPQRDFDFLVRGAQYVERQGYTVILGKHVRSTYLHYLSGSDSERLSDIHEAFANPAVKAIFCSRGGYGSARLLEMLDYDLIRNNPKIFIGFSDTTALQAALLARAGLVTFAGAMPAVDMRDAFHPTAEQWFWSMLTDIGAAEKLAWEAESPLLPLSRGTAYGRLLPVNLTVAASIIGSRYFPEFDDIIVLPEDVGEEPYRVDRTCTQLLLNENFRTSLRGILWGQFSGIPAKAATPQPPIEATIADIVERANVPSASNFPFGHVAYKATLPFGVRAKLTVEENSVQFSIIEPALSQR